MIFALKCQMFTVVLLHQLFCKCCSSHKFSGHSSSSYFLVYFCNVMHCYSIPTRSSCWSVPPSDGCIIILSKSGCKAGRPEKTLAPQRHSAWAAAGLSVQYVEWHLHFKRGRWKKTQQHFYNIWHPRFPCSTTSSFTHFSRLLAFQTLPARFSFYFQLSGIHHSVK